ncbi:MAG: tetratricopeptide repeat protein [Gammaproteobacteria bacterium]|nr:tetratricopeptide repeat protein [Gammaproteobacteria bacterium]
MSTHQNGKWIAILVALLFAGCASTPDYDGMEGQQPYGDIEATSNKISHAVNNPAVVDLWQKAEFARTSGDYETAAMQLERALRIEPNDAVMWSRLAEVQLLQENANQAENLAVKSNAMTLDNPLLNYRNWLIIARARTLKGDDIGAQEAEYTANSFKP